MSSVKLLTRLEFFSQIAKTFPEFSYLGDPILHTPTNPVSVDEGREIGQKLGKILIKYHQLVGYGRGLAANQISIPKSVFVTFLDDQIQTYINPKIIKFSQDQCLYRELCLSSGIIWADIKRSATITLQWTDNTGQPQKEEFTGPQARLLQHEAEHLIGIHSLDHAEPGTIEFCLSDPLLEKLRLI